MHDLQRIIADLKSKNDNIRLNAVKSIEKYKEAYVEDYLIEMLLDYNPDIRAASAIALSKVGNEKSVNPLIKILSDSNKEAKKAAIIALGKLGDYRVINHLRTIIRLEHSEEIRKYAQKSLEEIEHSTEEMLSRLEEELASPVAENKKRAIKFLTTIGTASAISVLLKATINSDKQIQVDALEALDKLKHFGIEPFVQGLKSEHWKIRMVCVEFLGRIKNENAIDPLTDLLEEEENIEVKSSIVNTLGDMGLEDSLYSLRNLLSSNPELLEDIMNAISRIGGDMAIEYLVAILKEEKGKVAEQAEEKLINIGYKSLPFLFEDYYKENDKIQTIIKRIVKALDRDSIDYFLQLLSDSNVNQRKLAIDFLSELEAENTIQALEEVSEQDSDRGIKKAAAKALAKLKKKYKSSTMPTFQRSESLLHRFSTFFSDQIEKISKSKKPSFSSMFKADRLNCSNCGGVISRKASSVEIKSGRVDIMRFGICPQCERIFCKGCSHAVVIRGLTSIKCPNCNVELTSM